MTAALVRRRLVSMAVCAAPLSCAVAAAPPRAPTTTPAATVTAPRALLSGDESFRARPPAPEPRPPYNPPVPRFTSLANGMGVLVVERHSTPVVAAELVVRGGSAAFPSESSLTFEAMAKLTTAGTKNLPEAAIYEAMNSNLFELASSAGDAWVSFRTRAIRGSFFDALELLRDAALSPTFPANAVEVERQRLVTSASRLADDTHLVARRTFFDSMYGRTHPCAQVVTLDGGAAARLTRDDIVRVWRETMDPAQAILVVAGDVDAAALRVRVDTLFGGWKRDPSQPARQPVPAPAPAPARLIMVDRPGASQATVIYGGPVAAIDAPEHLSQRIVMGLLGGMRSSAVENELRDDLGATGVAGARMNVRSIGGVLYWQGDVRPDRVTVALTALQARLRQIGEHGPGAGELDAAKAYIGRAEPRSLETAPGIADQLAEISAYHLPLDELATLQARLDAITPDQVRAAAPDPSQMKVVVVGDLTALREPLESLGWGPSEERDIHGDVRGAVCR